MSKITGVWWEVAFVALLAGSASVLLASPSFPSEDGPLHLYYVDVLRGLLTHSGPYPQYFQLKTLLTPYALEYYLLLALETVFSPLVSEKLLICGYIAAFGFGFRCLVESAAAERHSPWTLAGIPFCMNMLVYLGFLNYCFGIALTLLLSGLWIKYSARFTPRRVAALLAGFVLLLLTHPVAVAIFLLFIGLHFAVELAVTAAAQSPAWMPHLRARRLPLVLIVAMAGAALAWIRLFVGAVEPGADLPNYAAHFGLIQTLMQEIMLRPVAPFTSQFYCGSLMLLPALAGLTLVLHPWRQEGRLCPGAIALLATSAICCTLFCFVPPQINGAWFFPERFPIVAVLFSMVAAVALHPSRGWSQAAGVIALCVTVAAIATQWVVVSRIGREMLPALEASPAKAGSVGVIVGPPMAMPEGLTFDPILWSGVQYFRRSQAILANTPWMDQTHIPLRPVHPDRWSYRDPDEMSAQLSKALDAREQVSGLDFLVEEGLADPQFDRIVTGIGMRGFSEDGEFVRLYRR